METEANDDVGSFIALDLVPLASHNVSVDHDSTIFI